MTAERGQNRFVVFVLATLCASSAVFALTGYSALYLAWVRGDLEAAAPFLSWTRVSGLLAVAFAVAAFVILFSSTRHPIDPKLRLRLSLVAACTTALFAEFRNEGKFYFGNLHHFLTPGEWLHDGLNRLVPSLGDFLYRMEFSHWNDFLIGPAIVSVVYAIVFGSIYRASQEPDALGLSARGSDEDANLNHKLQCARILMYVGLIWFFLEAWGEKAGYIANRHSKDLMDLPFEFGGTAVGFWMARGLTRPAGRARESFRSTLLTDFVASGVIGLLYSLVVGPLTENVGRAVAHALYPVVPESLEGHDPSLLELRARPLELLLLAAATWWVCNRLVGRDEEAQVDGASDESARRRDWTGLILVAESAGVTAVCLFMLAASFSLLAPQGLVATLTLLGAGWGAGAALIFAVHRAGPTRFTTLFDDTGRALDGVTTPGAEGRTPES